MFLRIRRRRITFSVTALLVIVTAFAITMRFAPALLPGSDGGRIYFSPDTLETKWQHERLLLATDIPISRTEFTYYRKALINYLIKKGYWSPQTVDNPRWIMTCYWNHRWRDGHTDLHRQLRDAGTQEWIDWCEAHPKIAALVWPRVLELLRSEAPMAGSEMTHILFHARRSKSIDEYKDWLKRDSEYQSIHSVNQRHLIKTGSKVTYADHLGCSNPTTSPSTPSRGGS